jgi:hypothetical protein
MVNKGNKEIRKGEIEIEIDYHFNLFWKKDCRAVGGDGNFFCI